jgi:UDP-N-acetylmuramoyl-tripeptide--D-alanyl-D-alanine ligase
LANLSLISFEKLNRRKTKQQIRQKIESLKKQKLKVIGITGSYGKTSVKEYLYQILKTKYKVLKTPESFNTLFGIVAVIDYELDDSYDYFICEIGAYEIGEIKEICEVVKPDYSILTGINEQHIERFGSIENTTKAKFELAQYVGEAGISFVNADNERVFQNYKELAPFVKFYGFEHGLLKIKDFYTNNSGSNFRLEIKDHVYELQTKLIGKGNIQNVLAAISLAYELGVSFDQINLTVKNLNPIEHRLELKALENGLTIIDDSYSSNVTGFREAVDLLSEFKDKVKIIATPGIVELGELNVKIHNELGSYAEKVCDKIFLISKTERTQALYDGVKDISKVTFINNLGEMTKLIEIPADTIVLIENDLPDNY